MGADVSVNLNTNLNLNCFSIIFGHTDRLRLILAPEEVVQITQNVLSLYWTITNTHKTQGFVEFKLSGRPWYSTGTTDLDVKYFTCALLKEYYSLGWHVRTGSDIHRNGSDTSVLFFERKAPLSTNVICLSLNDSDKIRVLATEDLIPVVRQVITNAWPYGIQHEQVYGKGFEFKLKGNPWTSGDGEESYYTPVLVNEILYALRRLGWIFSSAIDTAKSQAGLNAIYLRNSNTQDNNLENTEKSLVVSLHKTDRIRVIGGNDAIVALIRDVIPQTWLKGIQEEKLVHQSFEFKLKGNPWSNNGEEAVDTRRLMNSIFHVLRKTGWELFAVMELSKSVSSKSTLFFRYTSIKPGNLRNICLSFNESDKIRIVDGDELLVEKIRYGILMGWPKGIQTEKLYNNSFQYKLHGNPFSCSGESQVHAVVMLLIILNNMNEMGLSLIGSVDVSAKYYTDTDPNTGAVRSTYKTDLHSWFFQKD